MITTKDVQEAHCDRCGHDWIIRSKKDKACPECRRKRSKVTSKLKTRCLCISCHHVWIVDMLSDIGACSKCGAKNEEGKKKAISTDSVTEYTCGSCGNVWIGKGFGLDKDEGYCKQCGCGREEAWAAKMKEERDKHRVRHFGLSSYKGHPQHQNPDTGEWEPSKEEIDAKIAAGIWTPPAPLITIL
jgi:hypothetical protein